jgi:hypothetical protein
MSRNRRKAMRFGIGIQHPAKASLHYGERLDFDVLSNFVIATLGHTGR